ncbi:MAG: ATP-binding protein [Gammaproteobacteria bacterium]
MRYFRNYVHRRDFGYFGYLQLTSPEQDYARFILGHLIDSLNQPYDQSNDTTGLMRLSNAVAESSKTLGNTAIRSGTRRGTVLTALREWDLSEKDLGELVSLAIRRIVRDPNFLGVDNNVLATMLYLQAQDPFIKNLVITYLRSQTLAPIYQDAVPALAAMGMGLSPVQMIAQLAKLMWATDQKILVLCIDQLEGALDFEDSERYVRQLLGTVVDIASNVPSSLMIISCLESVYEEIRDKLTAPIRFKIETPPSPCRLKSQLETIEQVQELIAKRLSYLYDEMDVASNSSDSAALIFPIPEGELEQYCLRKRARQVLNLCGKFHLASISQGNPLASFRRLEYGDIEKVSSDIEKLENTWRSFLADWSADVPSEPERLALVLAQCLPYCDGEIHPSTSSQAVAQGKYVKVSGNNGPLTIGICNKKAQGGGLLSELREFEQSANGSMMVIARCAEFPKSATSQVSIYIGELIARGARRAQIEDPDWRALMAFPEFHSKHVNDPPLAEWQKEMRPLTRFLSVQRILGLEDIAGHWPEPPKVKPAERAVSGEKALPKDIVQTPTSAKHPAVHVGMTDSRDPQAVLIDPSELTRHAAFLGGSGSGKSTLAMNLIEQLLLREIPVVLVDRKGDLASYASPQAWETPALGPELESRRKQVEQNVDIALYTPGHPLGRPLAISIVPEGTHLLPCFERERISGFAAEALAHVMGFRASFADQACRAILRQAIYLLTEINDPEEVLLDEIADLVGEQDPALINLVGALEAKNFKRLQQALLTLRNTRGQLLKTEGERLSADLLFGLGQYKRPGKTKLSIVSTKFFSDNLDTQFFIAQMLLELGRWISKHPSNELQGVVMFDEADVYLPATYRPATKGPMEDLLKRARSGGLGIFLATQSPGDFDYRCKENVRTWFIGKIKETTALAKLKPMLSQASGDVISRLGALTTGEFCVVRDDKVDRIRGGRCAIALDQLPEDEILNLSRR